MEMYVTEEQQVEQIKKLWDRFGSAILYTIIVLALIVVGYNYWQRHVESQQSQASLYYQTMLLSHQENDTTGVLASANTLIKTYPKSIYAQFAQLELADNAVQSAEYEKAKTALKSVIDHSSESSLVSLAKIRLARVMIMTNEYDNALKEVATLNDTYLSPLAYELRGDILTLQRKSDLAKKDYESALKLLSDNPSHSALLKMKIENLA